MVAEGETMNVIEIRDPHVDQAEILKRISEQVKDKTVPDFSTIGPEILRNSEAQAAQQERTQSASNEALIELMLMHQLEEPEFVSDAPVVGPWIVRLRQLWNWMSTKWYVLPIIKQQSNVNGQIAVLLLEMETRLDEKNQLVADLEEKVNRLEAILAANKLHEK